MQKPQKLPQKEKTPHFFKPISQAFADQIMGFLYFFLIPGGKLAHSPTAVCHGREETTVVFNMSTRNPPRADTSCPRQPPGSLPGGLGHRRSHQEHA